MKNIRTSVAAIFDGYSTGKYLAPFLHKRKYETIHIQSSLEIPDFMLDAFCPEFFTEQFVFTGDLNKLVNQLSHYDILAVLAGDKISQILKTYAFKALDLLEISHGPGHFEIMLTKEGPKIIEMGARIQGGIDPNANAICLGYQQIDKTLGAYLMPEHFLSYHQQGYQLNKFGLWVFLISEREGVIDSLPIIEKNKSSPLLLFHTHECNPRRQFTSNH